MNRKQIDECIINGDIQRAVIRIEGIKDWREKAECLGVLAKTLNPDGRQTVIDTISSMPDSSIGYRICKNRGGTESLKLFVNISSMSGYIGQLNRRAAGRQSKRSEVDGELSSLLNYSKVNGESEQFKMLLCGTGDYSKYSNIDVKTRGDEVVSVTTLKKEPISKRKIVYTACVVSLIAIVATSGYAYWDEYREIPLESISFEETQSIVDVCTKNILSVVTVPDRCYDIEYSCDNDYVSIENEGKRVAFIVSPCAKTGESFNITAHNERYGVDAKCTFTVENNLKITFDTDVMEAASGSSVTICCNIDKKYGNLDLEWHSTNDSFILDINDRSATLHIPVSAVPNDFTDVSVKVRGTDISAICHISVNREQILSMDSLSGPLSINKCFDKVTLNGTGGKTYSIPIQICVRSSPLEIVMKDVTISRNSPLTAKDGNQVTLAICGHVEIYGYRSNAIDIPNLRIVLNGSLVVHGGDGFMSTTQGVDGEDGFIGINSDSLEMCGNGTIDVIGGAGGRGCRGNDGISATQNGIDADFTRGRYSTPGQNGTDAMDGTDGGDGGFAIFANNLTISDSPTITLKGGRGADAGSGGRGGSGSNGGSGTIVGEDSWSDGYNGSRGGSAGRGGSGGDGGNGSPAVNESILQTLTGVAYMEYGSGGSGGDAGSSGTPGRGGDGGFNSWFWAPFGINSPHLNISGDGGNAAPNGNAGNGGSGHIPGSAGRTSDHIPIGGLPGAQGRVENTFDGEVKVCYSGSMGSSASMGEPGEDGKVLRY